MNFHVHRKDQEKYNFGLKLSKIEKYNFELENQIWIEKFFQILIEILNEKSNLILQIEKYTNVINFSFIKSNFELKEN